MDQDAFRKTYHEVNQVFCAFEKSVLTNECQCSQAERFCIAEREGVHCRAEDRQARCLKWLELLREQARFALRAEEQRQLLPHGKAIRLQVGGMRGEGGLRAVQGMLRLRFSSEVWVATRPTWKSTLERAMGRPPFVDLAIV